MKIINLNREVLNDGRRAYRRYKAAILAGPMLGHEYEIAMARPSGVEFIPGAVAELLADGIRRRDIIIHTASRVALCRGNTAQRVIDALTGDDPEESLWRADGNELVSHDHGYAGDLPRFLIAA